MTMEGNPATKGEPAASGRYNSKQFMAGIGLGLLGWALCLVALLLAVVLEEEKGVDLKQAADRLVIALLWLPGASWMLWRLAKQRTQGLPYLIAGVLAGLALPFVAVFAFMLVYGIPHA